MARNKYPKRTIDKILDVSIDLFAEKGYEETTIQDIVNHLGMSKGAIYHHFKSKEEILLAIAENSYDDVSTLKDIIDNPDMTGLDKLKNIFKVQLSDNKKKRIDAIMINAFKNSKLVVIQLQEVLGNNSDLGAKIIKSGIEDGSIQEQDPHCAAQVILLLINFWIAGGFDGYDMDHIKTKVLYLRTLCEKMGVPVIDDEIETLFTTYFEHVYKT